MNIIILLIFSLIYNNVEAEAETEIEIETTETETTEIEIEIEKNTLKKISTIESHNVYANAHFMICEWNEAIKEWETALNIIKNDDDSYDQYKIKYYLGIGKSYFHLQKYQKSKWYIKTSFNLYNQNNIYDNELKSGIYLYFAKLLHIEKNITLSKIYYLIALENTTNKYDKDLIQQTLKDLEKNNNKKCKCEEIFDFFLKMF